MTDKQITDTLRNIKEHCKLLTSCGGCHFYKYEVDRNRCLIKELIEALNNTPQHWDMEEIERIINETD